MDASTALHTGGSARPRLQWAPPRCRLCLQGCHNPPLATHCVRTRTRPTNPCYIHAMHSAGKSTVLKAHTAAVRAVDFANDGHHLVSCSNDKSVKVDSGAHHNQAARNAMYSLHHNHVHKHAQKAMGLVAACCRVYAHVHSDALLLAPPHVHQPPAAGLVSGHAALCAQLRRAQQLGAQLPLQCRCAPGGERGGGSQRPSVGCPHPALCSAHRRGCRGCTRSRHAPVQRLRCLRRCRGVTCLPPLFFPPFIFHIFRLCGCGWLHG